MEHCPYLLLKSLKKTVHESLLVLCVCCPGGISLPHARQALTGAAEGLSARGAVFFQGASSSS